MDGDSTLTTASIALDTTTNQSEGDTNSCQVKLPDLNIQCTLSLTSHPPMHRGVDVLGKAGEIGGILAWPVLCHEVERQHVYGEFCVICQMPSATTLEGIEELRLMAEEARDGHDVSTGTGEPGDESGVPTGDKDGSEEEDSSGERT